MRHRQMTHPLFYIYYCSPSFLFAAAEQNQALLFGGSE